MTYIYELYKTSPEYLMAFKEGFEYGQSLVISEMMSTIRKVSKVKAIQETSGTAEINPIL